MRFVAKEFHHHGHIAMPYSRARMTAVQKKKRWFVCYFTAIVVLFIAQTTTSDVKKGEKQREHKTRATRITEKGRAGWFRAGKSLHKRNCALYSCYNALRYTNGPVTLLSGKPHAVYPPTYSLFPTLFSTFFS